MRTRTSWTLTIAAAAATAALTAGTASAAPAPLRSASDDPVPASPTLVVTGNGYGHGHGMSQYGAKGAAEAGQGYAQILDFYYHGTTLGTAGGKVRVLLTADSDNNLKVASAPGLRVHDLGNGRTYKLKKKARAWRLKSVAGQTRVYFKTGHWHLYKTGGRKALAGDGELKSSAGQLTLKLPGGTSRAYRGKLRFTNSDTVNVLRLERYLKGVIAAEMPSTWPAAALQSQAVAARTYAARERADHTTRWYDLCDTTACQVYGGVATERPQTNAAADATSGKALVFGAQYAFAQFSSSSGGYTSASVPPQPYLTAHDDPYDRAVSPYLHWKATVDTAKLQAAHPEIGTLTSVQVIQRESSGTTAEWGGWVQKVRVSGTGGTVPFVDIGGGEVRTIFGLRSAYFTFDPVP
jgi:peptidoglycan hydrolase-like amidase